MKKYKDPRWQMKRLKIFERDEATCQICFDSESTLHVHHLWYEEGDPWDVPNEALLLLCESCHEAETDRRRNSEWKLTLALRKLGCYSGDFDAVAQGLNRLLQADPHFVAREYQSSALAWFLADPSHWTEIWDRYMANLKANPSVALPEETE